MEETCRRVWMERCSHPEDGEGSAGLNSMCIYFPAIAATESVRMVLDDHTVGQLVHQALIFKYLLSIVLGGRDKEATPGPRIYR